MYAIQYQNREAAHYSDPKRTVTAVHGLINYYTRANLPKQLAIHSGCATYNNKSFLVIGEKWAGKTTLLCKLMFEGFDVHGDEYSILDDKKVIPYPRKFHVKEGTLNVIQEIAELCKNLTPYILDSKKTYFMDPQTAGFEWKIAPMKPDTIFYLEPNHGRESKIYQIPGWQVIQKIIHQVDNFSLQPGQQIKDLCRFVNNASCFVLYSGDLNQAVHIIKESLS